MRSQVEQNMNSAKFIAVCFGLMTLLTVSVVPILSALSGLICASLGVCSVRKGINSTQYYLSSIILVLIAARAAWVMQ